MSTIAVQKPVVEHQINEEVFFVKGELLLPRLEEEVFAEVFDVGDDGRFQLGL